MIRINCKLGLFFSLIIGPLSLLMAQNQVDDKGRKQGEWIKKDSKGKIIYKGQFKDDYPVDTFYYYDKRGRLELKNYFSENGQKTHCQFIYPNGKIKAEGYYINKKKEGLWIYYTEKGIKITEENYKNNLKDGQEKKWETKGKDIIEVTNYKKGVKDGEYFQTLYGDGYFITYYKDDKLEGDYKEYYPDKNLKIKGQFVKGDKQGRWEVYDMTGTCIQKLFYENNEFKGDLLRFDTQNGIKEIAQKDIAVLRKVGKQTQIVLFNGDKINVFNSLSSIVPLTSVVDFVRVNEKDEIYLNVNVIEGLNANKSIKTKIDLDYQILPDTEGLKLIESMFRTEFEK
ncbi:MAG: toxin-antitoxin system YwqK family antitoxin [Bacteroidales bacterium]